MFDNPRKELERLEQQLLAAEMDTEDETDEMDDEEFDRLYDDIYDEFGREEPYEMDDELRDMLGRSAGFDAEEEEYYMDSDRYVSAPQKGIGGLAVFALLLAISAIALAVWMLGRML